MEEKKKRIKNGILKILITIVMVIFIVTSIISCSKNSKAEILNNEGQTYYFNVSNLALGFDASKIPEDSYLMGKDKNGNLGFTSFEFYIFDNGMQSNAPYQYLNFYFSNYGNNRLNMEIMTNDGDTLYRYVYQYNAYNTNEMLLIGREDYENSDYTIDYFEWIISRFGIFVFDYGRFDTNESEDLLNAYYCFNFLFSNDGKSSSSGKIYTIEEYQNNYNLGYTYGHIDGINETNQKAEERINDILNNPNNYNLYTEGQMQYTSEENWSQGYNEGVLSANNYSTSWFMGIFTAISSVFSIRIFGDITLGTICLIPFAISFVWFIIKVFRGGQ